MTPALNIEYSATFGGGHTEVTVTQGERMASADVPAEILGAVGRTGEPPQGIMYYGDEQQGPHPKSALIIGSARAPVCGVWLAGGVSGAWYVDWPSLATGIRSRGRFGEAGAQAVVNRLRDPSLLVLDCLDEAQIDAASAELLHPILKHRHVSGLPVIVTSSVPLGVIERRALEGCRTDEGRDISHRTFSEMFSSMGRTADERARHVIECVKSDK